MSNSLRHKVLQSYKSLHRAKDLVFHDDSVALAEARRKINDEFKKQKHVKDLQAIEELVKYSKDVEKELRTCVIQAKAVAPGRYQAVLTKDTLRLENVPFKEDCCQKERKRESKSCKK